VTKRWVITGCRGQLGTALLRQLEDDPDAEILAAVDLPEVDVADPDAVVRLFEGLGADADVLVNAAAFTHVDRCEREPENARRANAEAPGILAQACDRVGCHLVHVSTDYVFAGEIDPELSRPHPYREEDPTGPRSEYGRSKLAGEQLVREVSEDFLIVRTSWVFGRGRNFVAAILGQAEARHRGEASGPLRVVDDQRGRPTYAVDLASGIRALCGLDAGGTYHLAGGGEATWWEFARAALDAAGYADVEVDRIRTGDLELDAPRPAYSVLDCTKAADQGVRLRDWRDALEAYLASEDSPLRLGAAS
jgi:dTDP-4-dehydrorhamnose reductase